jgi:hypothetical protein
VDIWDQAYNDQGTLAVMAFLLVFIAMSVATIAQRISNRRIKAAIHDLGVRETIIAHLSRGPTESYFASLKSVIDQTDSPWPTRANWWWRTNWSSCKSVTFKEAGYRHWRVGQLPSWFCFVLLRAHQTFFDVPNVHFVLGTNMQKLQNSVSTRYGAGIDAGLYLQNIGYTNDAIASASQWSSGREGKWNCFGTISMKMGLKQD